MSIKFIKVLFAVILTLFYSSVLIAQVGIGVPAGEEPQSTLDVRFDSAVSPGFLMPRVTALPTGDVAEGMLIIYCPGCTDTDGDGQINYETGTYYVYVDNDGDGTFEWTPLTSNAGVVEVDTEAPSTPTNLTASNPSSSSIDLSWTASTDNVGVAGYFIYYNDGTLATTAPSNSITVTGLEANTSYTFYVTAYDSAMNESSSSNTASETTQSNCVASTICQTSFEGGSNGCWSLAEGSGSTIQNTNTPGCSSSAYDGSFVIEIKKIGAITSTSNDFTNNTSVDISFYHMGYNTNRGCNSNISNTIYLQVSTNGASWNTISTFSSSGSWQEGSGTIDGVYMTSGVYIRILVDGSSNKDFTLLDFTRIDVNCD